MNSIIFSLGNDARSRRAKNYDLTWPEFVAEMRDYSDEPGLGVEFTGAETREQYDAKKKRQNYIAAAVDKIRSNNTVLGRSILFIDLDGVSTRTVRQVTRELNRRGMAYFAHGTSSDRHALKGGAAVRAVRFLVPTDKPMSADEIWHVQHSFLHTIGLLDAPGVDLTACQRARVMFVPPFGAECWEGNGKPVSITRMLNNGFEPPSEHGTTVWTEAALAAASENSQAIAGWAFDMGLEPLTSGRGWALQCPNAMAHTSNDGTDGSTAILLPDAIHPEIRFQCQHAHCAGLNGHQHLALDLAGVPGAYLPEAHNISKKQLAELLPFVDDDELEHCYQRQVTAAADGPGAYLCSDDDLLDAPAELFTKRDPVIEGLYNFRSSFELVGESNIGKSFFLLGQMACVAAGLPFAGARVIKSHCFYFDAEGGSTTDDRRQALQKTYGDPLDWLHVVDLQAEGWDLTSKSGQRSILRYIRDKSGSDPVGLVAFDSLNQTVALRTDSKPFDENNSSDMGAVATALKHIADETGGCVGVVHHPAKSDKNTRRAGRGSGALHGAVDFVYYIDQPNTEKPLQINLHMEKARGCHKQLPRGFVLSKCKIDVAPAHDAAIAAMQSQRPAPDFSEHLAGFTPRPYDHTPRDETLVLIPVALAPFDSAAGAVGRKAAKQPAKLTGDELAIYEAVEQLQNADDRPAGFTASEIIKVSGAGGRRRPALTSLIDRGLLVYGRNNIGKLFNGEGGRDTKYRLPMGLNDGQEMNETIEENDLND
jgi:hypothetical protein